MSRVGKNPIPIPDKVNVKLQDGMITVTGPKGELDFRPHKDMKITMENNSITRKIKKCNHFFHSTCLDKWLENHITCPTCRQDITTNTNNEETNGDSASVNNETTI